MGGQGYWGVVLQQGAAPARPPAPGPSAALLFTNRHEIRRLALDGGEYRRLLGPLKHAGALDADVATGTVYWADLSQRKIYR